ncbi:hypothetical protein KDN32_02755 [Nocardioides sp. J2M5]|uniref:hypothetical protein n=1 Tax=Nocardioides palaemonis TaxID=2829810 RepID=UPI001BAD96F6|nr:hypothetical protein [Nocardioides palaemonis]MBS2936659.1 hypothetical protein [Nocardioides palaemonis]
MAATLALSACSTEQDMRAVDPAADEVSGSETLAPDPGSAPDPMPDGPVRTDLVTVLDNGSGPQLCLGAVAESYPPQCGGPAVEDFEWGDVGSETAAGVTWGQYALTGTFDGSTFTVTDAIPAALYDTMGEPAAGGLEPACDDAEATDQAKATPEDMDATLQAASALPTYATAWLSGGTISVAVTGDADAAEETLRQTWGGLLCVTTVEKTDADLNEVNTALQQALGDRLLTSGSSAPDSLDARVVFDDGSIQEWADATYGAGLVRVTSALTPAS